jgi:hypothetical protein
MQEQHRKNNWHKSQKRGLVKDDNSEQSRRRGRTSRNESSYTYRKTFGPTNKDSWKCYKRRRQAGAAFRIKKKTEGGQLLVPFVRPQLFFCKRVDWSKSKVEPAANTVAIVAFEIYLASAAVS